MSGASEVHTGRIQRELRLGWARACVINACTAIYFLLLVRHTVTGKFMEEVDGDWWSIPRLLGLAIVGGLAWTFSRRSLGRLLVERTQPLLRGALPPLPGSWVKSPSGIFSLALLLLTLFVGWRATEINLYDLLSVEGLRGARNILSALLNPNWEIWRLVLERMMETIFMAFVATMIAVPIAFCASFPSARNLMRGSPMALSVYSLFRVVANFTRSVEPVIWAIVFSVWVKIGPFAGMLALMLHSVASLTKLYSEQIEGVDRGPLEAIEATGAGRLQVLWYAVVPQVVLPFLSFTIYRWDINIRMATIIGLVGGGGVGTLLLQYQGHANWHEVGTIVIVIALVVWAMDYLSARIREAIY